MKQKKTLKEISANIETYTNWASKFVRYSSKVIQFAKEERDWQDWDKEVFNAYFSRKNNHFIGSLRQGDFDKAELRRFQDNWDEIKPILSKIANDQHTCNFNNYSDLFDCLTKLFSKNKKGNIIRKKAAVRRLITGLQPQLLCTVFSDKAMAELINYLKGNIVGAENLLDSGSWYQKSSAMYNFFKSNINLNAVNYEISDDEIRVHTPEATQEFIDAVKIMQLPWYIFEQFALNPTAVNQDDKVDNMDPIVSELVNILTEHKPQIILQGPPGTGKTYTAKDVAEQLICGRVSDDKNIQQKNLETSGQFELIQFHPSYSYEDFVQGISVKIVDKQAQYNVEARVLMEFAHIANQNNIDSSKPQEKLDQEAQCNEAFSRFVEKLIDTIDMTGAGIALTNSVCSIARIASEWFVIEGSNDRFDSYIRFDDIKMSYLAGNITRKDIVNNLDLSKTARAYASYVERILTMFRESEFVNYQTDVVNKVERKNYVLIIDEINRANLATVLGELIYALEYRGKPVKTLYSRSDDESQNQIILPPNLYIIGTMNTADRSVNSMDYAIRRRFSFINMLPKYIESEDENFDEKLFECVSNLFVGNLEDYDAKQNLELVRSIHLSEEFRPEDVWIGHSYFIGDEKSVQHRIKYEIIPLIEEYIQDGILKESAREIISFLRTGQY